MDVVSSFEVPAAGEEVWSLLLDVPRIIPCMPGAELLEVIDDSNWKARVVTRLGPMRLDLDVAVRRESVDEASRTVRLVAEGSDRSGRGGAAATITSRLQEGDGTSLVEVATDLALTGAVARFGRQGLVRDVAAQMTDQFATNLSRELGATVPSDPQRPPIPSRPAPPDRSPAEVAEISTGRMILGLILRSLIRRLERLTERVERTG